jgi:HK97 family phage major capsid protein
VWADIVKLVSQTKAVNAPDGQAYITSPAMVGRLQITPRQSSGVEGNFIMNSYNGGVNGYQVLSTTNLPDTFTKGGSTVLSAIIFGDFSNLVIGSWGGMEIGVDPYVNMKEGLTNIVLNSYVDCGMLNPLGFSVIKDAQSY